MDINLTMDYDRVEIRLPKDHEVLNPKLVDYWGQLTVEYEFEGQYWYVRVFDWGLDKVYFLSDRSDNFTIPGGTLRIFDIKKEGLLQERS
ncbi:MAG: hypothetical protein KAR42_15250 [candidate division Zixibacteria bacterium]|nr:hypothetical protein [candidate division Zixibacteria bacterium]